MRAIMKARNGWCTKSRRLALAAVRHAGLKGTAIKRVVSPDLSRIKVAGRPATATNSGTLDVDAAGSGGSNLAIGATLSNSGTVNIGNTSLSAASTRTRSLGLEPTKVSASIALTVL
jgi:hypothetical protein